MSKLSIRLREDFGRSRFVMGKPVIIVRVLIAVKIPIGLSFCDAMTFAERLIVTLQWIGLDQRCPMSFDAKFTFLARISRNNDLDRQAHHGAEHGISYAGIAGA